MDELKQEKMEWMKVYLSFLGHRKIRWLTEELSALLKNDFLTDAMTSGIILTLWMQCAQDYPDGQIADSPHIENEIAKMCQWKSLPDPFVQALVRCRWLEKTDNGYHIRHWEKYREEWIKHLKLRAAWRTHQKKHRNELKQLAEDGRILKERYAPEYDAEPLRKSPQKPKNDAHASEFTTGSNIFETNAESPTESSISPMTHKGVIDESSMSHKPVIDDSMLTSAMTTPKEVDESTQQTIKNAESTTESTESVKNESYMTSLGRHDDIIMTSQGVIDDSLLLDVDVAVEEEKDKDNYKDGGYKKNCADPESGSSPTPHLVKFFMDTYKAKTGKAPTTKPVIMGNAIKKLLLEHDKTEIRRRIQDWFDSPWPWVSEEAGYRWHAFMSKWEDLADGPLKPFAKTGRKNDGGFDRATGTEEYKPDF